MLVGELGDFGGGPCLLLLTVVEDLLHAVVLQSRALKTLADGPDAFILIVEGDFALVGQDLWADTCADGALELLVIH